MVDEDAPHGRGRGREESTTLAGASLGGEQLLVSGLFSNSVTLYDGGSGAFIRRLATLRGPQAMVNGPDGNLYVVEENRDKIVRFDGMTGARLGDFVFDDPDTGPDETGGLDGPTGMGFGADGHLYVASFNNDSVLRYDGTTGAFIDEFVAAGSGGISAPTFLHFVPEFRLRMTTTAPPQAGEDLELVVSFATPDDAVLYGFGTLAGAVPVPGCPGAVYGIANARRGGRERVDADGTARLLRPHPGQALGTVLPRPGGGALELSGERDRGGGDPEGDAIRPTPR